ncbi:DUF3883 domain-containing protein [Paenibacillus sp. WC2504]|uniref:DUF3883 domain-containing protein n=1 Tax=Paenibacillus sp. WC2504 TaxID=3461403 RepID=UPI0040464A82
MKKFCDLLWTIRTIQDYEGKYQCQITRSHLLRILEGSFLGGRKTKAQLVLDLLLQLKLLGMVERHQVFVLPRGNRLSESGVENSYELNAKQKKLITSWYVPTAYEISRQWVACFSMTASKKQQATRTQITKTLQQWTEEMLYLGVAVQSGDCLELVEEHAWMRAYQLEQPPMTLEELQAILELQAQSGREAEDHALRFEKRRLQEQGLVAEAVRIECISDRLVNAGYDILSYTTSAPKPNRFIEVKSVGPDRSFYWSRHELEVARVLGSQYYLYLVDQTDPIEPTVDMIENPYVYISLHAQLEPIQYRVTF